MIIDQEGNPGRLLATFFSRFLELVPQHYLLVQSQNDGLRIVQQVYWAGCYWIQWRLV